MRIRLDSETEVDLSHLAEPGFDVTAADPALAFGAMPMFVCSVALCTHAVLASYAERIGVTSDDLRYRLRWRYADRPRRIASIDMQVRWPGLPPRRTASGMPSS